MRDKIRNKRLKQSSKNWLQRQINDPFVAKARQKGYRSRAAFKIIEIQKKFKIIDKSSIVLDLGAAPGGWSQVIAEIAKKVIAIDLLEMSPIPNVEFINGDFTDPENMEKLKDLLPDGKANVIVSDMAPNTCGIGKVDHIRIISLLEEVYNFCKTVLSPEGILVTKVFQGGAEATLLKEMKLHFRKIVHFKPSSSRKESPEIYLIAIGFKA